MKIQPDTYLTTLGYAPLPKKYDMAGWMQDFATPKQKAELSKFNIAYTRVKYKGQASLLLSIIYRRANQGLATPKQIQVLLQNGYKSGHIRQLTVKGASKIICKYIIQNA